MELWSLCCCILGEWRKNDMNCLVVPCILQWGSWAEGAVERTKRRKRKRRGHFFTVKLKVSSQSFNLREVTRSSMGPTRTGHARTSSASGCSSPSCSEWWYLWTIWAFHWSDLLSKYAWERSQSLMWSEVVQFPYSHFCSFSFSSTLGARATWPDWLRATTSAATFAARSTRPSTASPWGRSSECSPIFYSIFQSFVQLFSRFVWHLMFSLRIVGRNVAAIQPQ